MGAVRTAIELQDNFTGILHQVISSVNLGLSAMEDLQQVMGAPVDMGSIASARDSINQAAIAAQELDAAMQEVGSSAIGQPAHQSLAPITLPVQPDAPDPLVGQPQPVELPVETEQPEPVEIPIEWRGDSLEVFRGSGMERFEQEARSANNMLDVLNRTQGRIVQAAADMDFLPPGGLADLASLESRLQAIQQHVHEIGGNPMDMGLGAANAELEAMRGRLGQIAQAQEGLNRAVGGMDVQEANAAYLRLSQTVGDLERQIRDNASEQGRFNREVGEGRDRANGLVQAIKGAVAAYATIQTLSAAAGLSDTLASTSARLEMMDGGLHSIQELQGMIYQSAERARGSYQATADAVSKLGLMAGDAFSSSEEIIAFMEQVNKQFTIAGTEAAGVEAAMLQLTQAMGSGVLRGEEYNSILEQAPNIIQAIADYMEVPKGQLKDMAAEGQITADIVKAAMFAAADETDEKFKDMPMTFEQVWTSLQNTALTSLQPILESLNKVANSEAFQGGVDHAAEALSMLASIAGPIIEEIANSQALWDLADGAINALSLVGVAALEIFYLLAAGVQLAADNWSWLSPIIYGVAGALAVYYGWQFAANAINAISHGIHIAMAAAQMIHAAAIGTLTTATATNIAAQNGLNAALYACPIVWIIILIIALIAIFYAAVAAVNKFAGTSVSATGIVCGVFMVAAAFIGNLFVTLINFVIDIFAALWNFIAAFANFFGNVFNDPVGAIARLFFDLFDWVLGILESIASAIDTLFGSNLAGAVSGWRGTIGGWVDKTFGQGDEIMAKVNGGDFHLNRFEYGAAWDAGYSFGEGIEQKIGDFDPSSLFGGNAADTEGYNGLGDYGGGGAASGGAGDGLAGIGGGVDDIAGNTGKIADSMDVTEEDLKYLRDIAEQEAVNRFTTAEITIEQTNNNTVSGGMDLDGVVSGLTDAVREASKIITEGVHG